MAMLEKPLHHQQVKGTATILAIGTANPCNCYYQADYPDFYFHVTNSEHMTELKEKLERICSKSAIKKRYLHITEEILRANPNIGIQKTPSFDARQDMLIKEVPKLGKKAALKSIKEWRQPISKITPLVFCTTSCIGMPGPDYQLVNLLGLNPSTKRYVIYMQGCYAGGTALQLGKDLAENNINARVLVVCVEITTILFHAPSEAKLDILIAQPFFSDSAAAVIIGANPDNSIEHSIFQIVSASQTIIPNSEDAVVAHLGEIGLSVNLSEKNPEFIGENIGKCLTKAFCTIDNTISDWNSLFYVVHPGGRAILDEIKRSIELKLRASRHVLNKYGNMAGPCVLFVLDEMRKRSMEEEQGTTGEGLEWGVLFGFGPGLTVETLVLHSIPMISA